jgi:uncharacterized membrane protein
MRRLLKIVATAGLFGCIGAASAEPPEFLGLGRLAETTDADRATAVSGDGSTVGVVIGRYNWFHGRFDPYGYLWTEAGGLQAMPGTGNLNAYPIPYGVSGDGSAVAGTAILAPDRIFAFHWTPENGYETWTPEPGGSYANALSADGFTVVGIQDGRPFSWTSRDGLAYLHGSGAGFAENAHDVSADGSVIVGTLTGSGSGSQACRWMNGQVIPLGFLPGATASEALGVSDDGSTVVGRSGTRAFFWRAAGGMKSPAIPAGYTQSQAWAVSGDGSVVVCTAWVSNTYDVFTWDRIRGSRILKQTLQQLGVAAVNGWTLDSVGGISTDGTVIVGGGTNPQGQPEAWLARIPAFCYANCDGSTVEPRLNVADFTCFMTRYANGDPYANCDESTVTPALNVADFICFLGEYSGGCR